MVHVTLAVDGEVVENLLMPESPANGDLIVVKRDGSDHSYRVTGDAVWFQGDPFWLLQIQVEDSIHDDT